MMCIYNNISVRLHLRDNSECLLTNHCTVSYKSYKNITSNSNKKVCLDCYVTQLISLKSGNWLQTPRCGRGRVLYHTGNSASFTKVQEQLWLNAFTNNNINNTNNNNINYSKRLGLSRNGDSIPRSYHFWNYQCNPEGSIVQNVQADSTNQPQHLCNM